MRWCNIRFRRPREQLSGGVQEVVVGWVLVVGLSLFGGCRENMCFRFFDVSCVLL